LPEDLQADTASDEYTRGRSSLRLRFTLSRGAYATLIVKRIMQINRSGRSNP